MSKCGLDVKVGGQKTEVREQKTDASLRAVHRPLDGVLKPLLITSRIIVPVHPATPEYG